MKQLINNNNGNFYLIAIILFLFICFMLLSITPSNKIETSGILNDVTISDDGNIVTIYILNGDNYTKTLYGKQTTGEEYKTWIEKGLNTNIEFSYYTGSLLTTENTFISPTLHLKKNTTIKKVIYSEGGIWWFEKPPVRVVLGDGSNFIFYGSEDEKFAIYSEFIIHNSNKITVHYTETFKDNQEFKYIEEVIE